MDSDESGNSESEFYYPEEETLNQMMPRKRRALNNIQEKKCYLTG